MRNRVLVNYIASLVYQFSSLSVGLILPRYYIEIFGSTYNGLNQTITQVMSLLAIFQYGIAAASIQAMFKPIAENDDSGVAAIYRVSGQEYRRMGYYFLLAITPIVFIYPIFVISQVSYWIVVSFFIFRAISSAMEYFFQAKYSILLIAHNKSFAIYIINTILLFVGFGFHLTVLFTIQNILLYQFIAVIITFLRLGILTLYIRKKFSYLSSTDIKQHKDNRNSVKIKNRKDVLISELAGLVIDSTDLIVLSIFASLLDASIYSVYNFVLIGLSGFLSSAREAVIAGLGKKFHENKEAFVSKIKTFESIYLLIAFVLYSVAILMFKPFILLYTKGMDAEYFYPLLPLLFVIPRILTSLRIPSIVGINISGDFKQVKRYAIIEAIINLTLSLILVKIWGIYGVLMATIIAAVYRTPVLINYTYKHILKKSPAVAFFKIVPWMIMFAICVIISFNCNFGAKDFVDWVVTGGICFTAVGIVSLLILFFTDKAALNQISSILIKK